MKVVIKNNNTWVVIIIISRRFYILAVQGIHHCRPLALAPTRLAPWTSWGWPWIQFQALWQGWSTEDPTTACTMLNSHMWAWILVMSSRMMKSNGRQVARDCRCQSLNTRHREQRPAVKGHGEPAACSLCSGITTWSPSAGGCARRKPMRCTPRSWPQGRAPIPPHLGQSSTYGGWTHIDTRPDRELRVSRWWELTTRRRLMLTAWPSPCWRDRLLWSWRIICSLAPRWCCNLNSRC